MKQNVIYIIFTSLLFISIAVVFNFFPRSKVSELEKRELNTFPPFSWNSLLSGSFTNDVSIWYSDSEPFRDRLMTVSMLLEKQKALVMDHDDHVTFHKGSESGGEIEPMPSDDDTSAVPGDTTIAIDDETHIANAGIITLIIRHSPMSKYTAW